MDDKTPKVVRAIICKPSGANVCDKPNGEFVLRLPVGSEFEILKRKNNWVELESGWVHRDSIQIKV